MNAYSDDYFEQLFPVKDGVGLEYCILAWGSFVKAAAESSTGIRPALHVIRDKDGKVLSAVNYYIIPDGYTAKDMTEWRVRWGPPLPGMSEEKLDEFYDGMSAQHELVMAEKPHFCLEVIMTHSTARKRGYGTALLQHGNKMADDLNLPSYLDAEKDAASLYEEVGYVYQKDAHTDSVLQPMLRPALYS